MSTARSEIPVILIRPSSRWAALNLRELWQFRELVFFMTWRDIMVRYKQTLLGAGWAILRPFLTMVVFSIFFGSLAKVPSDNLPYPIFAFSALLPWELFLHAVNIGSHSLVNNRQMITKVYFPRMILPLASVLAGVVDFLIASVVLIGMMIYYKITPTSAVWTIPLFLLLTMVTGFGVSLWLSSLNVLYRDVGYVTPFIAQLWLFITPIAYGSTLVPEQWRFMYALNPMVGVVNGFRWALLNTQDNAPGPILWISVLVALAILISGLFYFRRMERQFADMV
jgi:lipopolysaccharide transport system permease protein